MDRPKEIFFTYSSSKFQMMRDGFIQEYSGYQISKEQEEEWLNQLIQKELNQLDINNKDSLFPLGYILETNCITDQIDDVINFISSNFNSASTESLISFISKTDEIITRIEESNRHRVLIMNPFRERLKNLRAKIH